MIIQVRVFPSSGREEIILLNDKEYKIYLKKPAEDNKANLELLKTLKKHFSKQGFQNINIIKGLKSKNKIIEVK